MAKTSNVEKVAELPGPRNRTNVTPGDRETLPATEEVYLFGEITDERAGWVVGQLACAQANGRRVRLWICSLGGDLGAALAIHDALQRFPGLEAIATGNCQSAALVAFLGAETRWATPNTIFHNHAITGTCGEQFPPGVEMPALKALQQFPFGTFGADLAREYGLIAKLEKANPDGGQAVAGQVRGAAAGEGWE